MNNGSMILRPIKDKVMSLAGKYKTKMPIRVEKIRKYIDYTMTKK